MGASSPSGGRGGGRRRRGGFTEINVTPFVDVMLVLLIIFMVTAPMLTAGVEVDLPDTNAAPVSKPEEPLAVSVDNAGNVYVQDTQIEVAQLREKLKAITGEKKDTVIYVRGDTKVDYGRVMQVMGEINGAGYTKVALLTDVAPSASGR